MNSGWTPREFREVVRAGNWTGPTAGCCPGHVQANLVALPACGVTPEAALLAAGPELAVTHAPGHMLITDLRDDAFLDEAG